ncbi:MAG TPA: helix-turn-helix domain-containing protein [Burkholderiaceae bacterium]
MKRLPRTFGCPTELALELLGGKWKTVILARLKEGPQRYGELRRQIPRLSDKMLTQCLHGLQERGLVARDAAPDSTARYRLTPAGRSLRPLLQQLYDWGDAQVERLGVTIRDRAGEPVDA